jgi:hypothetical protein
MFNALAHLLALFSRRSRLAWHRYLLRRRIRSLDRARRNTYALLRHHGKRYERICLELIRLGHQLNRLR